MIDETPAIELMHRAYTSITGLHYTLDRRRMDAWRNWLGHGWTKADLVLVVDRLRKKIFRGQKWQSSLNFKNLIERVDYFEEELVEARAFARRPVIDIGKAQVMEQTGRKLEAPPVKTKTAGDVMDGARAFAEFKAWRAENGL